eukprot:TRINITY_DN9740_c0_g1_i1.p1 TRINITY_DN9740_c0_g1~~TRINITY_DN9740_c0_g1_i1.p1  ORF type:complete len:388 (-),score=88.43 TRINITY_DN9740_c0_g1_i1:165-1328(-)
MDNYEWIPGVIGKGTFGQTTLVRRDGRTLIAKSLRLGQLTERDRRNAFQEAEILQRCRHPNIIAFVDAFTHSNVLYIIQEYADGGDLLRAINAQAQIGYFSERRVKIITAQLCMGLRYLHGRKVLHRDLKTENVFLTRDGKVKLGDLGLSRVLHDSLSLAQTQCGTANYFSPEVCHGRLYNAKSDIWSLGCVLYEVANFARLFDGRDTRAVTERIKSWDGKFVMNPLYTRDIEIFTRACLTKEAALRPTLDQLVALPFIKDTIAQLYIPAEPQPPPPTAPPSAPLEAPSVAQVIAQPVATPTTPPTTMAEARTRAAAQTPQLQQGLGRAAVEQIRRAVEDMRLLANNNNTNPRRHNEPARRPEEVVSIEQGEERCESSFEDVCSKQG